MTAPTLRVTTGQLLSAIGQQRAAAEIAALYPGYPNLTVLDRSYALFNWDGPIKPAMLATVDHLRLVGDITPEIITAIVEDANLAEYWRTSAAEEIADSLNSWPKVTRHEDAEGPHWTSHS